MRDTLGFFKLGFVFLQLPLSLLDHRFCLALLANVGDRSHELEVTCAIPRRVSSHTDMLDGTVGQLQAMLKIKTLAATRCLVDLLLHRGALLGMNSLKYQLQGGLHRSIMLKDVVGFLRPVNFSTRNVSLETAAVPESLCFQ